MNNIHAQYLFMLEIGSIQPSAIWCELPQHILVLDSGSDFEELSSFLNDRRLFERFLSTHPQSFSSEKFKSELLSFKF